MQYSCDRELTTLRHRNAIQESQLREKETRIGQLERRVEEVSSRCAQAEKRGIELEAKVNELDGLQIIKEKEHEQPEELEKFGAEIDREEKESTPLEDRFRALYRELLEQRLDPSSKSIILIY